MKLKFKAFDTIDKIMSQPFDFNGIITWGENSSMTTYNPNRHKITQFYMSLSTYLPEGPEKIDLFEGDIVEVSRYHNNEIYIVFIDNIRNTNKFSNLFGSSVNSRKIIGNIYENPDLITQFNLENYE